LITPEFSSQNKRDLDEKNISNLSSQSSESSEKVNFKHLPIIKSRYCLVPEVGVYFERKKSSSMRKIPDILTIVSTGVVGFEKKQTNIITWISLQFFSLFETK